MAKTVVSAVKPGGCALHVRRAFLFLASAMVFLPGRDLAKQAQPLSGEVVVCPLAPHTFAICSGFACLPARRFTDLSECVVARHSEAVHIYIDNAGCTPYRFCPPGMTRASRFSCSVAVVGLVSRFRPNGPGGFEFAPWTPMNTVARWAPYSF